MDSEGILVSNQELVEEKDIKISKKLFFCFKRLFDLLVSLTLLIICIPIFLIISLIIKIDSKGPIFYKHKRIGKKGKVIYLYKFRSMYKDADEKLKELLKDPKIKKEWEDNYKLNDDPRITRVGKILRITSIDELPQILNIIKGDMTLIGPRPLVEGEIEKYGRNKAKFLSVTPGITGWWACNGRSCRTYEERMKLELYYIDHMSLWLDIKIIFKTVIVVLKGHGAK